MVRAGDVTIIGLAGASASGKSTLGERAVREIPGLELIKLDKFFKDIDQFPRVGQWPNWEVLESLKLDELYGCLCDLKAGRAARVPLYSKTLGREIGSRVVPPARIVLIEGFLLLHDARIRAILDRIFYLKADAAVLRDRRFRREPEIDQQYYDTVVAPSIELHIASAERIADIVIDANGSENHVWDEFHALFES